jgi:hypothetical protein
MKRWFTRIFTGIGVVVVAGLVIVLVVAALTTDRVPRDAVLVIDFERAVVESIPADPLAAAHALELG